MLNPTPRSARPAAITTLAQRRGGSGFSLIEMAIVLVIVGLLLGGMVGPLASSFERARIQETRATLSQAREALLGFALVHGTLPHADADGDGIEDPGATGEGTLPWATLGLSPSAGRDGWGLELRYRPEASFLSPPGDPPDTTSGIRVQEAGGAWSADNPDGLAALILSFGRDGLGNGGNGDGDARYTRGDYCTEGCTSYFDDQLEMVSKNVLIARLATAGRWP